MFRPFTEPVLLKPQSTATAFLLLPFLAPSASPQCRCKRTLVSRLHVVRRSASSASATAQSSAQTPPPNSPPHASSAPSPSSPSSPPKPDQDSTLKPSPAPQHDFLPLMPSKDKTFVPKTLSRPLGVKKPPSPGENDGVDYRPWRQRRDDFFDWDKHLKRRKELTVKIAKPYFRDWTAMRVHKGKLWIAPRSLIRADRALYIPNFRGSTLALPSSSPSHGDGDTTSVLRGHISVVVAYCSTLAEQQAATFVSPEHNPKLAQLFAVDEEAQMGLLQRVDVNMVDTWLKAALVKLFMGRLRAQLPEARHGKYFLVSKGISDDVRMQLGMINAQIGYVFLVDPKCRIRWAGSAEAMDEEKDSLAKGVARLVVEAQTKRQSKDDASGSSSSNGSGAGGIRSDKLSAMTAAMSRIVR